MIGEDSPNIITNIQAGEIIRLLNEINEKLTPAIPATKKKASGRQKMKNEAHQAALECMKDFFT